MQKGDIAKLKLLLAGISARMTKNRDYFIRAVCTFTSGKKKFDAELSLDGQNWALRFQGSTSPTDAAAFCAFFASEAEKFDESVLVYTERSAVVTLSATARGVQMKQAEREASDEEKANAANPLLDSGRQYLIRVDQAAEKRYRCHFAPCLRYCDRSCPCDRAPRQSEIYRVRALLSQGTARSVYHARPRTADPSRRFQGAVQ